MHETIPLLIPTFSYCGTQFVTEHIFFRDPVYLLTKLWDGRLNSGIGSEIFLLFQTSRNYGAHPASYSIVNWTILCGQGGRGINLIPHLHLAPRLRVSGAIPLLPLYAFMSWLGTLNVSFLVV